MNENSHIKLILWGTGFSTMEKCEKAADAIVEKGYRKQREGEWVWKTKIEANAQNRKYCSVCDTECPGKNNYYLHPKYCHNCGAKMKGE